MARDDYTHRSTRGGQFNPANPFRSTRGRLNDVLHDDGTGASCRIYGWNPTEKIWEPTEIPGEIVDGVPGEAMPNNVIVYPAAPLDQTVESGAMGWMFFVQGDWFFFPDCSEGEMS